MDYSLIFNYCPVLWYSLSGSKAIAAWLFYSIQCASPRLSLAHFFPPPPPPLLRLLFLRWLYRFLLSSSFASFQLFLRFLLLPFRLVTRQLIIPRFFHSFFHAKWELSKVFFCCLAGTSTVPILFGRHLFILSAALAFVLVALEPLVNCVNWLSREKPKLQIGAASAQVLDDDKVLSSVCFGALFLFSGPSPVLVRIT